MVRVKVRFGFGFGSSSGYLLGTRLSTLHLPARRRAARRSLARRDRRCTPLGLRLGLGPGRRAPSRDALAGEGEGLG